MNLDSFLIGGSWWTTAFVWGAAIALLALLIIYWRQISDFTREAKVELQKASWPWDPKEKGVKKYRELIDSTLIVVIAMLLLSGYVAGWDFIMNIVVGFLFKAPVH